MTLKDQSGLNRLIATSGAVNVITLHSKSIFIHGYLDHALAEFQDRLKDKLLELSAVPGNGKHYL